MMDSLTPLLVGATGLTFLLGFESAYSAALSFSAALVLAALWIARAVAKGDHVRLLGDRALFDSAWFLGVAVLVAAALSPVASDSLTWGFRESTSAPYWIACVAIFVFAAFVTIDSGVRRAIGAVAAALVAAGVYGALQHLGGTAETDTILGGSNYLGPAVATMLPLALGLSRTSAASVERWVWRAVALASAFGAFGSGSDTAKVALAAAFIGIVVLRPSLLGVPVGRSRIVRVAAVALTAAAVAFVLIAAATSWLPSALDDVVDGQLESVSVTQRFELWQVAWRAGSDRPLTGWGPDSFQYATQARFDRAMLEDVLYRTEGFVPDPRTVMPRDAHSFPLALFAELGLLGVIAFGLLAGVWTIRAVRLPDGPERARDLRASMGISVCVAAVASLAVPVSTINGLVTVLLAGLAINGPHPNRARWSVAGSRKGALITGGVCVAVALAFAVPFLVSTSLVEAAFSNPTDARVLSDSLASAQRWTPTRSNLGYQRLWADANRLGGDLTFPVFEKELAEAPKSVRTFAPFEVEVVRIALDRTPTPEVIEWAETRLDDAARRSPNYPEVTLERARLAMMKGDEDRARQLLESVYWTRASMRYRAYAAVIRGKQ